MSASVWIAVACIAAAASTVQVVAGFGFSLFAVPLLSFPLEPKTAVVVAGTAGLVASGTNAWREWEHRDRGCARRMVAGALVGSPVGLALLTVLPQRGLRFALAIAVAAFVVLNVRGLRLAAAGPRLDVGAGVLSGTLNTMLSTNGPPLVAVLHARHLQPQVFRATLSVVFAVSSVVAIALYAIAGRYDGDAWRGVAIAVPAIAIGQLFGGRWRDRVEPTRFRRGVTALLALTAIASAAAAIAG